MPTNDYSRSDFLRALLNQQKNNLANGGSLLNPSVVNGSDLENSAALKTTLGGSMPINGNILNFDVEKAAQEQKSAGHTGNWFLDGISNIQGFADEIAAKFGAGFVGAFEGILDFGATALGALGDATGWYDSNPFTKWAEQDIGTALAEWTKTYANGNIANIINGFTSGNYFNEDYWRDMAEGAKDIFDSAFFYSTELKDYRKDADKYYNFNDEVLQDMGGFGEFLGGAAHSIGFMLPSILTGGATFAGTGSQVAAKAASLASMGLSAAGKGSEEALNDGANAGQALGYGAASGAVEVASEIVVGKALGVVGLGTGKVMGVVGGSASKTTAKIGSKMFVKELGKTMFEEGTEEIFSAVLEPLTKSIYKGEVDIKGTYQNPDWWFGTNGHFNESVAGQFTSGAFVGGLSGGIQMGSVYKKVGADGYATIQSVSELVEADNKMAKLEKQAGFDKNSKAYIEASNARAEAMSSFIENMDKAMKNGTETQKRALAEMLTNKGALAKALKGSIDVNESINNYLTEYQKGIDTHEKSITRSFFNEMQAKYGTDVKLVFDENMNANDQGSYNKSTNTLSINPNILNEKGGKVIVHEYFAHALSDRFNAGQVRTAFNEIIKTDQGKDIANKIKNGTDSKGNLIYPQFARSSMSDIKLQEEVLAHFLEQSFEGKNVATQLNKAKGVFSKSFLDNILNVFNRTEKFKASKIVKEYAKSLNQFLKKYDSNGLRKVAYKKYANVDLSRREEALYKKYGNIVDAIQGELGEQLEREFGQNQQELQPAYSRELDEYEDEMYSRELPDGKLAVQSPIVYQGNKFAIIDRVTENFPDTIKGRFIDAFSGSATVAMNADIMGIGNIIANEINPAIYGLQLEFKNNTPEYINKYINQKIREYDLRNSEDGFNKYVNDFNNAKVDTPHHYLDMFILQKFSYNRSTYLNADGKFEGKYNPKNASTFAQGGKHALLNRIRQFHDSLQRIELTNKDAFDIIKEAKEGDFIYVDPPYLITNATYNEGWTAESDKRLFELLDEATSRGVRWQMSNVIDFKESANTKLASWSTKYLTRHIEDVTYGNVPADEIIVKNYTDKGEIINERNNYQEWEYNFNPEIAGRKEYLQEAVNTMGVETYLREKWLIDSSSDKVQREWARSLFEGKISLFEGENLEKYYLLLDDLAGKKGLNYAFYTNKGDISNQGNNRLYIKAAFWTPEMKMLYKEHQNISGHHIMWQINMKGDNAIGFYNPATRNIHFGIQELCQENAWGDGANPVIRHERGHLFQHELKETYYTNFESKVQKLFDEHKGLFDELLDRELREGHKQDYYEWAYEMAKDGHREYILHAINEVRTRNHLNPLTQNDLKQMGNKALANMYNEWALRDEIMSDTYGHKTRVMIIYDKYGVSRVEINKIINDFTDAVAKEKNVDIMFSRDLNSAQVQSNASSNQQAKTITFKSIRTTEDVVTQSSDYIRNKLGKGYNVHYPSNFDNFTSKAFTEINDSKNVTTQARHLVNILLDTQITQNNKVVGTLDELLDTNDIKALQTAVEGIIKSSPDTQARSNATLPFEKSLDRAVRNVQQARTKAGRAHVWQNLRNSIKNRVKQFLAITDDNISRAGYQPLLEIFNETHWNGRDSYKLGNLRNLVESALEKYTEENIAKNYEGLQYDPEVYNALVDLEASLPSRQTIVDNQGNETTRDVSLDDKTIDRLIDLGRLVKKAINNQVQYDADIIRPAVRQGIKSIQRMSYAKRQGLAARLYRSWKRGFAPVYVVLEQMLGSNSVLSRKITYEMQMNFNKRQAYVGAYSDAINKKLKELGIRKTFDTKTFTVDGNKLTADQALGLYISLNVDINFNEINENGYQYVISSTGGEQVLSKKMGVGDAEALKAEVEKVLPAEYRKLGDFLLETMNKSLKAEYMQSYEKKFGKYMARNEIGEIGDKSYWMLFRSYQRANNLEKAISNPAGVFKHAQKRVKNQNAVLVTGALSSFNAYVNALGTELYVKPTYREIISILNTKTENSSSGRTIAQELSQTVGQKDFDYLMNSLADMVGANKNVNDLFTKAMSTFSVAKLSLNIGSMLKQFASIWTSNIPMNKSLKGFFSNIFRSEDVSREYKQLVDEIGGLKYRENSAGVIRANADGLGQLAEKIAQKGMIGISKVDLFTISTGVVSLMHIAQDQFNYKIGTEENKNWVKEHWTEFELSQIGNSALSKNAVSRGDYGSITKAIFGFLQGANRAAFGSQIHKLNLWARNRNVDIDELKKAQKKAKDDYKFAKDNYDLDQTEENREEYIRTKAELDDLDTRIRDYESFKGAGGKAIPVNTAMGLLAQGLFISLINELMKHIKGKKDWDDWDMFDDTMLWALNTLKTVFVDWVPFVNAISSAIGGNFERDSEGNIKVGKGYDVSVPVVDIANQIVDLANDLKSGKVNFYNIASLVGDMTGIPVSTIKDYVYGALKTFRPDLAYEMKSALYGSSNQSAITTLNHYVEKGDTNTAIVMITNIIKDYRTGYVSDGVARQLTSLYMNGYNALPKQYMSEYVDDKGNIVKLNAQQSEQFKFYYQQSDKAVRDLMNVQEFNSLTQEEKAKLVKKIYDLYYEYAKHKVTGIGGSSKLAVLLAYTNGNINLGNLVAVLNKVSQITENKTKTRKDLVIDYVNKQKSLTKQEKVLVMYLAGYKLSDNNKATLKKYLASKGVSSKNIKELVE